jgi:hypothetical protein
LIVKTFVTFESELPDDTTYGTAGDVEIPGGKNIAESISKALRNAGFVVEEPQQHGSYGWAIDVRIRRALIWCLLQCPGPWLLITEQQRTFSDWFLRRRYDDEHAQLNEAIARIVSTKPCSFSKWFTREEYESSSE